MSRRLPVPTALVIATLTGAMWVGPIGAQQPTASILDARREALPDDRAAYVETWLTPIDGVSAAGPGETAFGGRVTTYRDGGRERLEIQTVEGGTLGDPVVVVFDGRAYFLVTPVGAAEFASSARADDAFVRIALASPPDDDTQYRTLPAADGGLAAIVLRNRIDPDFDTGEAFALRAPAVGRNLLRTGLASFAAGDSEVAASAGARGVGRVRTAEGSIDVTPDPEAVAWMESHAFDWVAFETFRREARLPPYDALPVDDHATPGAP